MLYVIPWMASVLQLFLAMVVATAWLIGGTHSVQQTTDLSRVLLVFVSGLSFASVGVLFVFSRDTYHDLRLLWVRRLAHGVLFVQGIKLLLYAGARGLWERGFHPGSQGADGIDAFQWAFMDGLILSGAVLSLLSTYVEQLMGDRDRRG